MDSVSFSDGDNNGGMDCIVWGDDAPYSVVWSQDGTTLETVADTVSQAVCVIQSDPRFTIGYSPLGVNILPGKSKSDCSNLPI